MFLFVVMEEILGDLNYDGLLNVIDIVEIVNIISENYVKLRVWERGSGLTMACGTGACATVVSLNLQNLVNNSVEVELPGGNLDIYWPGNGDVTMEGPVKTVYKGELLI